MLDNKRLIDFHTHILPKLDDGSSSSSMSLEMAKDALNAGINTLIFTPHFYADELYPDDFIKKRDLSLNSIKEDLDKLNIDYKLGAEVAYYLGMSNSEELKKLTINNSKYILVEMPYCIKWNDSMISDILNISKKQKLIVILAHVHRYMSLGFKKYYKDLHNNGVLFQWNSEAFINEDLKKESLKFFEKGYVDIIGSDAHNVTSRKEDLIDAINILQSKNKDMLLRSILLSNDIVY